LKPIENYDYEFPLLFVKEGKSHAFAGQGWLIKTHHLPLASQGTPPLWEEKFVLTI
jgi:hypothetical protein